tara:strand:- start:29828 stop:30994 length:1167 start_codon:yes stop_codon:yes gene_type:complete
VKILILNCFSRNALAVINSLDKSYELIGAHTRKRGVIKPNKLLASKRLAKLVTYEHPNQNSESFKNDIIRVINENSIDAVIATGTSTTNYLSFNKDAIESATSAKALVEKYEIFSKLTDKWHTYQLCEEIGLPVPKSILLKDDETTRQQIAKLTFPVVAKPRISFASHGVCFFDTYDELIANIDKLTGYAAIDGTEQPSYMVQERITGTLHDVCLSAKNGDVSMLMTQQRVMTLHDFGGGGIINLTTNEPEMAGLATQLIKATHWNGLALFDFVKTPDGKYYLLEINPKVWGTTYLTTVAGLNMVQNIFDIFVLDKPVSFNNQYSENVLYRWLFPECFAAWTLPPRNPKAIVKRVHKTFSRHGASQVNSNIKLSDLRHLLGTVLEKGG